MNLDGTKHGNFKGDGVKPQTGRVRAERVFSTFGQVCEECGTKYQLERHHKDGNPINNDPSNIQILCRYHHMILDGRIHKPDRPCENCGKEVKVRRKGRCSACSQYFSKHKKERPKSLYANSKS